MRRSSLLILVPIVLGASLLIAGAKVHRHEQDLAATYERIDAVRTDIIVLQEALLRYEARQRGIVADPALYAGKLSQQQITAGRDDLLVQIAELKVREQQLAQQIDRLESRRQDGILSIIFR